VISSSSCIHTIKLMGVVPAPRAAAPQVRVAATQDQSANGAVGQLICGGKAATDCAYKDTPLTQLPPGYHSQAQPLVRSAILS
jgi:hypothetical protein